jgi:hypothetical protein
VQPSCVDLQGSPGAPMERREAVALDLRYYVSLYACTKCGDPSTAQGGAGTSSDARGRGAGPAWDSASHANRGAPGGLQVLTQPAALAA